MRRGATYEAAWENTTTLWSAASSKIETVDENCVDATNAIGSGPRPTTFLARELRFPLHHDRTTSPLGDGYSRSQDPLYIGAVVRAVTPVAARGAAIAFVPSAAAARHRRPDVALMLPASAAATRLDGARRCVPGPSIGCSVVYSARLVSC